MKCCACGNREDLPEGTIICKECQNKIEKEVKDELKQKNS